MNELFENTYEELRENFVRGRFAEEQFFGCEDIEEWLEYQTEMMVPGTIWRGLIIRLAQSVRSEEINTLFSPGNSNLLRRLGCKDFRVANHPRGLGRLLSQVSSGGNWEVYYTEGDVMLVGPGEEIIFFEEKGPHQSYKIHWLLRHQLLQSVFENWYCHGPEAVSSMRFLCEWLKRVIAHVRKEAEADFDRAVACSADGRKIIHADEVWVMYKVPKKMDVPSRSKILLAGPVRRCSYFKDRQEAAKKYGLHSKSPHFVSPIDDLLVCSDGKIFVTNPRRVPEELLRSSS